MSGGVSQIDHHLLEATDFDANVGTAYCTRMSALNLTFNTNLDLLLGIKLLSMAKELKQIRPFSQYAWITV